MFLTFHFNLLSVTTIVLTSGRSPPNFVPVPAMHCIALHHPQAFDNNAVYNFPGPAISQLASGPSGVTNPSGSGNNNAPTDNSGGNNTPNTPNVPNTPSPSDGSGNTGNTGSDNGYGYGGNQGDGYGSTDGNNTDGSSQGANDGSGSMGGCHLKKRSAVSVSAHQPRHLSRVMRDLITNGKNVMIH